MKFGSLLLVFLLLFTVPVFAQNMTTDVEGLEVTVVEKVTDSTFSKVTVATRAGVNKKAIAAQPASLATTSAFTRKEVQKPKGLTQSSKLIESVKPPKKESVQKTVVRKTTLTRTTNPTTPGTTQPVPIKRKTVVHKKSVTKEYKSPFGAPSPSVKKVTAKTKKKTIVKRKKSLRFNASSRVSEARQLLKAGEPKKAKEVIKTALPQVKGEALDKANDVLAEANSQLLFGATDFPGVVEHKVKSGESLYVIAKKYGTKPEFIAALNGIKGTIIHPNQKLKVISVPMSINVNKSKNRLELFAGKELIRTYPIATGTNNSSPVGTFTVVTKVENPTWYKTGAIVPPGDKENILGTRWLGFSLKGFGIHGTTIPESIGTQSTAGCVRMKNQDVEELYAMVPLGSVVVTVD